MLALPADDPLTIAAPSSDDASRQVQNQLHALPIIFVLRLRFVEYHG